MQAEAGSRISEGLESGLRSMGGDQGTSQYSGTTGAVHREWLLAQVDEEPLPLVPARRSRSARHCRERRAVDQAR